MVDRPWIEVSIETSVEELECLETWLFDAGALSVTLAEREHDLHRPSPSAVLEPPPGETPLWDRLTVTALFDRSLNTVKVHEALLQAAVRQHLCMPAYRFNSLAERRWERVWMRDFRPRQFGPQLWVCPSHCAVPDSAAVIVRLDPGLAFGTGTHPTTAQCLGFLGRDTASNRQPLSGKVVIDFGCGSGILAVTAALLGAEHVLAVDIDPQALEACRENARLNAVASRVETAAPEAFGVTADLLLANILYQPLMALANTLTERVVSGGRLLMAGMLTEQAQALRQRYDAHFDFEPDSALEGWALMSGIRRTD